MSFEDLIVRMGDAVCRGAFEEAAACFTPDGVYHDDFYGSFQGRAEIARLFSDFFYRDGENFRWSFHDPVSDGSVGYARYLFSWNSKLPDSRGVRAGFEGVSICDLKDGLIASYREVAATQTARHMMSFPALRLDRLAKRETQRLLDREDTKPHFGN
ncbi:MAG: nuclear transport factor 2 family protein [Minwuia sp.]|uniref:nuclear transport factor 2 family protein n=1 Tax=Minwuia sp. TaxID=2493630 RepID=UPI003A88B2AF